MTRRTCLILLLSVFALPTAAQDWDVFDTPGAIAIMRHALAPGTGDPADLTIGDCSTQRNLDAAGRAQARAIGKTLRNRGIHFDAVLSSQWCRTMETAELLDLGPVREEPSLNSFFRDRSTRDAQTREVQTLVTDGDQRLMLVTHFVNIAALTGETTRSGEVLIIRASATGVEVLGRVMIDP